MGDTEKKGERPQPENADSGITAALVIGIGILLFGIIATICLKA